MKFYTSVFQLGNDILVRGYENGKHFTKREPFQPRFFVPSKRESKFKTLDGQDVEPIHPGTIRECKEFLEKYDGVNGFKVYGNDRFVYQYIAQNYPEEEIKFDINKVGLVSLIFIFLGFLLCSLDLAGINILWDWLTILL